MKPPLHKTEGIIIRRFDVGEFDRILIVYTKEYGKISVQVKSLRKKEAKLRETLELFNHVHLMLAYGKNIDAVVGATIINSFPNLRTDLSSLAAVFYLSELLDKLIVAPEKDEQIWDLVRKSFCFLDEKRRDTHVIKKLVEKFEDRLLVLLGHLPALQGEALRAGPVDSVSDQRLSFIQNLYGQLIGSRGFLARELDRSQ
jgi:DNA repair protein RecO (recombination protein O)